MNTQTNKIKYISYHYRHTDRPAVTEFVNFNNGALIAEFVEGKRQWPRLVEAIEQCRRDGAILVIAKLGRLGRNARFLSLLLESWRGLRLPRQPAVQPVHGPYPGRHGRRGIAEDQRADEADPGRGREAEGNQAGLGQARTLGGTRAFAGDEEGDRTVGKDAAAAHPRRFTASSCRP